MQPGPLLNPGIVEDDYTHVSGWHKDQLNLQGVMVESGVAVQSSMHSAPKWRPQNKLSWMEYRIP